MILQTYALYNVFIFKFKEESFVFQFLYEIFSAPYTDLIILIYIY